MDVVGFVDRGMVGAEMSRQPREGAVERKDDVHANAEIGGNEECTIEVGTFGFDGVKLRIPTGSARDGGNTSSKATTNVDWCDIGHGKLNGDITRIQMVSLERPVVGRIDGESDSVSTMESNLLDSVSHFAISYQCYFHKQRD